MTCSLFQIDVSLGYILEKKHERLQSYVYASRNSRVLDDVLTVSNYQDLQAVMDAVKNADVNTILLQNR